MVYKKLRYFGKPLNLDIKNGNKNVPKKSFDVLTLNTDKNINQ